MRVPPQQTWREFLLRPSLPVLTGLLDSSLTLVPHLHITGRPQFTQPCLLMSLPRQKPFTGSSSPAGESPGSIAHRIDVSGGGPTSPLPPSPHPHPLRARGAVMTRAHGSLSTGPCATHEQKRPESSLHLWSPAHIWCSISALKEMVQPSASEFDFGVREI